jgi:chemotaxis protein MotB
MEVMVESHTDSKTINTDMFHENWYLSVKRATSVLRLLEEKYNMPPEKMIAGGRSSYIPSV